MPVQVLLNDDFELARVGESLRAGAGSWTENHGYPCSAIVTDSGPSQGCNDTSKQWARMDRARHGRTEGHFSNHSSVTGGQLHVSLWLYVVRNDVDATPSSSVVELGIGSTLAGCVHLAASTRAGNDVWSNDAGQHQVDRGVDFKDETWQQWQVWIDMDKGTFEYSVDDLKSGLLRLGNNDDESSPRYW